VHAAGSNGAQQTCVWTTNVSQITATRHACQLYFFGGEVVTSRYFHRKAVLSTLDQLGKTKTHTQRNLQKTRHTRPSSKVVFLFFLLFFWFFLFFPKHTDMATAAHIYMHTHVTVELLLWHKEPGWQGVT
jgi:hypothetical protein